MANPVEDCRIQIAQFLIALAGLLVWLLGCFARESDSARKEVTLDDGIGNSDGMRFLRTDGLPDRAHLDGLGHTREPRQPLGARGAGNDAQLHFRLSHLGGGCHHAVVPRHCDFQTSAERRAMDRHHHRLRAVLDLPQQGQKASSRRLPADHLAELANVGSRDERSSSADDHNGTDRGIARRTFDGRMNPLWNARTQRIHRGIGDRNYRYSIVEIERDQCVHGRLIVYRPEGKPVNMRYTGWHSNHHAGSGCCY